MTFTIDPLGLRRCSLCGNAFEYDADKPTTARLRRAGVLDLHGFVCSWCAARHRKRIEEVIARAEKEVPR